MFTILQTDQRVGWWSAHRLEGSPRYADADARLVTLLSPHVCRAITISDALNLKTIRSEALEATLNALTSGVYLVDRLGRIIYMNQAAERQIKDSNVIRIESNRLAPVDRVTRAALARAIDDADCRGGCNTRRWVLACSPSREGAGLVAKHPPANSWRTPQSLWRLCCHGGDLRARPNDCATIPG